MRRSDPDIGQMKLVEIEQTHLTLFDRFLVPPFSVLDARAPYWQARKREWLEIGIKSELGRDEKLLGFESIVEADDQPCPKCEGTGMAQESDRSIPKKCRDCKGTGKKYGGYGSLGTTSVFDPVLCELAYRWFCPPGGTVLDPFAGGSVRGIVAAMLGRGYTGIDLRPEQVQANEQQREQIGGARDWEHKPSWLCGDSRNLSVLAGGDYDMMFTCPPYYDLETYSDSPADLSNAGSYSKFQTGYYDILGACADALAPNTFAAIVVGEVRDKLGNYVGLVPDTIYGMERLGLRFYNEAILVTPLGSVPVRTSAQFGGGRKLGKTHQQLLVFVKGDAKQAAAKVPVEEVAVEQGGAVWKADGSAEVPSTSEQFSPSDPHGDGIPF